jgi:hypothetical protein
MITEIAGFNETAAAALFAKDAVSRARDCHPDVKEE